MADANLKSLLESKTFWVNTLTAVGTYGGLIPASPYTVYALLAANVILRILTNGPVYVLRKAAE